MNHENNENKYTSKFYAGLISGIVSNTICNPFDVIRTNKQLSNNIEYTPKFLSRGLLSGFLTIPTFWSIYFESYNKLNNYNKYLSFLNGYIACNIASTITCPLWFIRQKNQINNNFGIIQIYNFYKINGIKPFYNALSSTYIINTSFTIQIPIYEKLKTDSRLNKLIKNDALKIFTITAISKIIATSVFYPIDTIRTLKRNYHNKSIINIIKDLNKKPHNYYKGINIYLLRSIPYHTSTFCTYEYITNRM